MTKFFTYFFTIVILLALNMVWPTFRNSSPQLLFLLVVFYSFRQEDQDFLWLAFFSGILMDVFSGNVFGSITISLLVVALLINYTTKTFLSATPSVLYMSAVITVAYVLFISIFFLINSLALDLHIAVTRISPVYLVSKSGFDLIWNLILAAPVYFLTLFNDRIIERSKSQKLNI